MSDTPTPAIPLPERKELPMSGQQPSSSPSGESADSPPESRAAAPDTTWVNSLPTPLRPIALKYGQDVFTLTMDIGAVNMSIMTIMRRIRGNQELTNALGIITAVLGKHTNYLVQLGGPELRAQMDACKAEIESSQPSIVIPEAHGKIIRPS